MKRESQIPNGIKIFLAGLLLAAIFYGFHFSATATANSLEQNVTEVTSPLEVVFEADCLDATHVQINLDTAAYDVIARKIMPLHCENGSTQKFSTKLFFDVFEVPTKAHLTVSTFDAYNRIVRMYTNYVLLSPESGQSNLVMETYIPFSIKEPIQDQIITSQSFLVKGTINITNSSPINLLIINEQGRIYSNEVLYVPQNMLGQPYAFETTMYLPWLTEIHQVRLIMQQSANDIYGIKFATSIPLQIARD